MARVLVVDDEALIAMMLSDLLAEYGHETVGPAHSEGQALELVASTPIDAAILDVTLGDHDCFAVAEALGKRGIPFAFATGHGVQSMPDAFRERVTVSKPFDFEVVRRLIDDLVAPKAHL
ncbi:response regulator [Hyphomicrobium sp.]|uniref:response regulator n=1 Tax=Hyphomicrobium sp. TaxID=82 RepID=UPI0025C53DE9|nr:response regulator [Hyphomicrobium sp.]MCC7250552.1 response regulator [Hyphomicrobium sp.]